VKLAQWLPQDGTRTEAKGKEAGNNLNLDEEEKLGIANYIL
jgi:hypothetical protein